MGRMILDCLAEDPVLRHARLPVVLCALDVME